jgi:serine/threonine protein phosphatase PrpC
MSIRILQLHKRASYEYKYIQDRYALNSDNKTFALADGTTQSFSSELWAKILTTEFVKSPNFESLNLISQFKECVQAYKNEKISFSTNPAKASLERAKQRKGGTATFIGLQINKENSVNVISCGDTNLFLLTSENKIKTFPFSDINSLDANNHFINTEILLHDEIDDTFFKHTSLRCTQDDTIILATDALSRLILKKPDTIKELFNIQSFEHLYDFCIKKWEGKELEEDDISAIIIPIGDTVNIKLFCPSSDFQFPKEKEKEFIPASLTQNKPKQNSIMEMNEIRNQFNGVAKDMHQLKSKLRLHEILLMVTISLLMLNMLMVYLLRPKANIPPSNKTNTASVIEKKYEKTIQGLQSEIKALKDNITVSSIPGEEKIKE